MSIWQIQPSLEFIEHWTELASSERVTFEVIDDSHFSGKAAALSGSLSSSGLVTSLHGAFIDVNPASGNPGVRRVSREDCESSVRLAKKMGAERIVFHGSCFPFLRGEYLERWAEISADYFAELAERERVTILVENSMDVDPVPLQTLMNKTEALGSKRVGVCLDIGHASYSRTGLEEWFSALGPFIRYIHINDNLGDFDDHLPLGDGIIEWEAADMLLKKYCPHAQDKDFCYTIEIKKEEELLRSMEFLRNRHLFGFEG